MQIGSIYFSCRIVIANNFSSGIGNYIIKIGRLIFLIFIFIVYLNIISILSSSLTGLPTRIINFFNLFFLIITILDNCIRQIICKSPIIFFVSIVFYMIKCYIRLLLHCLI